jgi:hypothetical protein
MESTTLMLSAIIVTSSPLLVTLAHSLVCPNALAAIASPQINIARNSTSIHRRLFQIALTERHKERFLFRDATELKSIDAALSALRRSFVRFPEWIYAMGAIISALYFVQSSRTQAGLRGLGADRLGPRRNKGANGRIKWGCGFHP